MDYEEWRKTMMTKGVHHEWWQYAGDWFFPTPRNSNDIWKDKFYHICMENWKLDMDATASAVPAVKESCEGCGEEIPDGIKMIAALLTW
jgi:hypothetical protein